LTENATLARLLLADLVDRGLDPGQAILFVLDGGKALRRAIKDVFGEYALVQRCQRHYADLRVMPTEVIMGC
jgi:transposase-like protein